MRSKILIFFLAISLNSNCNYKNPYDPKVVIPAPSNFSAIQDGEFIRLNWQIHEDIRDSIEIERKQFDNEFGTIATITDVKDTTFLDNNITLNVEYTYRIFGYTGENKSEYTDSIKIIAKSTQGPKPPTLLSPQNESVIYDATINFDWTDISDIAAYQLQVDNSNSFPSPEIDISTLTTSNYSASTLQENGKYYWRVRCKDKGGYWGSWSNIWNFTIHVPEIEWSKTFRGESGNSVQETSDGGYIIGGNTHGYGVALDEVLLIKTDASGNEVWNRTFGGSRNNTACSVQETSDGGFIVLANSYSFPEGGGLVINRDILLIKTDASGNEIWSHTFGDSGHDLGNSVQETSDGGYMIGGSTNSYGAGSDDVWLIKTDVSGNEVWNRTFGGSFSDDGRSVQETSDCGFIIGGNTTSYGAGLGDVWLIKTDSFGNEIWNHTLGGPTTERCFSVKETSDCGFIVAGHIWDDVKGNFDVLLIKTDATGNESWSHTFGGSGIDEASSVQETSDGGYIVAGGTWTTGEGDVLLIKTDATGNESWSHKLGGSGYDYACSVQETSDSGFIITGQTNSYGAGQMEVLLIKVK